MGRARLAVRGTPVGDIDAFVVSPLGTRRTDPLPLLLVNDGPEYSRRAHLTSTCARAMATGEIPPTRIALLEPGERNERYAANPDYAAALTEHVLPTIAAAYGISAKPTVMGASLGALAALHAAWLHPGTFGGLFLQSGSFFLKRIDGEEAFQHWERVTAWVAGVRRVRRARDLPPIVMTCGVAEGNLHNNREMARVLTRLGHGVDLHEVPGGHDWRSWEAAFDPYLLTLLQGSVRTHGTALGGTDD